MFNTKLEVDKHVEKCLKKLNNVTERNLRCFAFAKLYFKIGDYEQARRYVSIYLNFKPTSAEGQHLLGKSLEKLGKINAALEAYRTSLDLDPKQNNLVLKVCELLASDNINFDHSGALYFCEKAQSIDPHNPAVFTLKERLILLESKDPNDVSKFLLKELEVRPTDVDVQIRLLRHLLQNNQIKEAYKHASDIEQKNQSVFVNSLSWYETLAEVLVKYQRDSSLNKNLNWEFWILLIATLEKLVTLSLNENNCNIKNSSEYLLNVFKFDQTLSVASENLKDCPEKHLVQEFLNHYGGQLCLHLTTLVYKEAKKEFMKFREAFQITLPLLFAAYHTLPADTQCLWFEHTTNSNRQLVRHWQQEAYFRCSQMGHMILSSSKGRNSSILEKVTQGSSGVWREQLFKKLFITRDQQTKIKTSYFVNCPQLVELTIRIPDVMEVIKYDEIAQLIHPDSLHHYIWIGLDQKLSHFKCTAFDRLPFSIKNLNNCAAESLNVLDIDVFLYCAILCAQQQIDELKHHIYYPPDKPNVLPAAVSDQLGTLNQAKWITAAYKMYKNNYGCDFGEIRLVLIKGIEVVRCVGNHGLDVKLLVTLAKTLAERAKNLTKQLEIEYCDARAELYWKAAMPLLEKLKNNQVISYSPNRLFEYKSKETSLSEIHSYIDDGKLFGAIQLMKKKEYEKALQLFDGLKDPNASFYQAQIFKIKAEEQTSQNKESVTSEMRSQNIILLSRARDCLYLTLDRLRDPSVDRRHPLNAQLGTEIDKIERMLSRIDPDTCLNRNECDGMSDENISSVGSMGDHFNYGFGNASFMNGNVTPRNENHPINSTPLRLDTSRREARPSPERLDAQLRQLAASKDAAISHIFEQIKHLVGLQQTLVDEFRDLKKSVDQMKSSAGDLQNITDDVYKMKKEIAELKKDTLKIRNNQLSDDDLYVLDEEYGNDYASINSNVAGLTSNLYPGIARIPAGNALPYGPTLYPGMYPMLHYPGLGIPQAGALPFGPEAQINDFRTLNSLSQGLAPAGTFSQPGMPQVLTQSALPQTVQPPIGLSQTNLSQLSHCGLVAEQPVLQTSSVQSTFNSVPTQSASAITSQFSVAMTSVQPTLSQNFLSTTFSSSKPAPVNVVITSSDPLPTTKITTPQPILSVTIPPQHLKGNQQKTQPHNYQIQLPSTTNTSISTPSVINQTPLPVSTQSLLSNVAPPIYSAVVDKCPSKNTCLGFVIEKSLSQSFSTNSINNSQTDINKGNISTSSFEEPDPCPDFKPIIPLPDEVPVSTGEEDEIVVFEERAKLFRYTDKEWRERGVGILKLLKNPQSGKVRILMRRDQVHKICANHFLTKDMTLAPMNKNDKAYIWAANDFADQEVILEKLCVRFKTTNEAQKFFKAFENAKKELPDSDFGVGCSERRNEQAISIGVTPVKTDKDSVTSLGGFVFTSTPTFKPKDATPINKTPVQLESPKYPFASFTFAKGSMATPTVSFTPETDFKPVQKINDNLVAITPISTVDSDSKPELFTTPKVSGRAHNNSSHKVDYERSSDFRPIIPFLELDEVKMGEENAEILFESKAKLSRFDQIAKDWKERGIGQMKILKCDDMIKLVMSQEHGNKVCCSHQLLKSTSLTYMPHNSKSICWYAQDYSEGILTEQMFAILFKTEEQTKTFHNAVVSAQAMLDETNALIRGDKKDVDVLKKNEKKVKGDGELKKNENITPKQVGWGDKYKPKSGSWECKVCYIVNDAKSNYCVACDTPKNENVPKRESESASKFSFGITKSKTHFDVTKTQEKASTDFGKKNQLKSSEGQGSKQVLSWGDAFKPKAGSWACTECYTRNDGAEVYCVACENPKESTIPMKEPNRGLNLDTPGFKFNFGIPGVTQKPTGTPVTTASFAFITTTTKPAASFSFGVNKTTESTDTPLNLTGNNQFSFPLNESKKEKIPDDSQFVFGSPQKHTFEFTPRSPRRQSSGLADEESENSYVEEEEDNIYFKPVIPLPEKIDVKTGEENEEVLFCHRSKLFRFVDGEWKERGIGDVKILQARGETKLRVLMRREQVLKICLNHALTSDINYVRKDDRTWLFNAPDFSEGEIQHRQFCIRFKNVELAQEFKNAIDDALNKPTSRSKTVATKSYNSDLEIVFETKVTQEEENEAVKLGLPPKFMAYRQLDDCTCEECKKDDILLKDLFISSDVTIKSTASYNTPTSIPSTCTSSLFGTPTNSSFVMPCSSTEKYDQVNNSAVITTDVLNLTSEKNGSESTLKDLLSKPSILSTTHLKTPVKFGCSSLDDAVSHKTNLFPADLEEKAENTLKNFSFTLKPERVEVSNSANIFGKSDGKDTKTSVNPFVVQSNTIEPAKPFAGTNVFGTGTAASSSNGIAKYSNPITIKSRSIFDTTTTPTVGGIFSSTVTSGNIFGSSSLGIDLSNNRMQTGSTFSPRENSFTNITTSNTSVALSILSTTAPATTSSIFDKSSTFKSLSNQQSIVNTSSTLVEQEREDKFSDGPILKCDSDLSFANLARNLTETATFVAPVGDGDKNPFTFLGAGAPVFRSAKSKSPTTDLSKENQTHSGDEGDTPENEEYDPHYEPIVPLPDTIIVSTGEEEEEPMFNERAKLFRYNDATKEWKERGVGQLKILYHPISHTYRFLLRREQVHKVVLNQLITVDLTLQPMSTSDVAWMWFGYNYSEDSHALEKLAARFKNTDLAEKFNASVTKAVKDVKDFKSRQLVPSTIEIYEEDVGGDDEHQSVDEEEEKEYDNQYDDDYDDEDCRTIMFKDKCMLSEQMSGEWKYLSDGEITIYYDSDIFGARISFCNGEGVEICNTLIGINTEMEIKDKECIWTAVDCANYLFQCKSLRASFNSVEDAENFHVTYSEGKNYAEQSHIVDEIVHESPLTEIYLFSLNCREVSCRFSKSIFVLSVVLRTVGN